MSKRQNKILNIEKGIACSLVIILHCEFPSYLGSVINVVARIGVPLFFIVSGYFLYSEDREAVAQKLPKKILRTLKLVGIYYLINIIYELIRNCIVLKSETLISYFSNHFDVKSLYEAVAWNRTLAGIGGWFLPALLYVYIVFYFINKFDYYNSAYCYIIPLFAAYFIISRTGMSVWYSRNYLFDALPFSLIGHWIAYRKEKITSFINNKSCIMIFLGGGGNSMSRTVFGRI